MELIKQTNEGLSTANVYADLIDLASYADMRNIDLTEFSDASMESSLYIASNDWVDDTHEFKGEKVNEDQSTSLPTDEVPLPNRDIVSITCMIAIQNLKELLFVELTEDSSKGQILSESSGLDVLKESFKYAEGTNLEAGGFQPTPLADNKIEKYLVSTGFGISQERL